MLGREKVCSGKLRVYPGKTQDKEVGSLTGVYGSLLWFSLCNKGTVSTGKMKTEEYSGCLALLGLLEKSWLLWILRAVTGFLSKVQSIGVIILFFWLFKSTIGELIEKVRRWAQRISTFPLTARELFMDLQTRPGGLLTFSLHRKLTSSGCVKFWQGCALGKMACLLPIWLSSEFC